MRTRTALTIGVIGTAGAISTYLFNKPALRKKMMKAQSPSEAASAIAAELEKDAADIATSVKDATMESWLMQELKMGKDAVTKQFKGAVKHAKNDAKTVKRQVKANVKAVKRDAKMMTGAAKSEVAHAQKKLSEVKDEAVKAVTDKVAA